MADLTKLSVPQLEELHDRMTILRHQNPSTCGNFADRMIHDINAELKKRNKT